MLVQSLVSSAYLNLGRMVSMKQSIYELGQCCITSRTMSRSPDSLIYCRSETMRYSVLYSVFRRMDLTTQNPRYCLSQRMMCCIIYQSPKPIYTILVMPGWSIRCCRKRRYCRPLQGSEPGSERGPLPFQTLLSQMLLKAPLQSQCRVAIMQAPRSSSLVRERLIDWFMLLVLDITININQGSGQFLCQWLFYFCERLSLRLFQRITRLRMDNLFYSALPYFYSIVSRYCEKWVFELFWLGM